MKARPVDPKVLWKEVLRTVLDFAERAAKGAYDITKLLGHKLGSQIAIIRCVILIT